MPKQKPNTSAQKLAYRTPRLRVYGNVRDITLTAANNNAADGPAGGNKDKTS